MFTPCICQIVEVMYQISDKCDKTESEDYSMLCDVIVPLTTLFDKMWPDIRTSVDADTCVNWEELLEQVDYIIFFGSD